MAESKKASVALPDVEIPFKLSLAGKLNHIQCELKAPKDKINKFGGYNYRSAEGILEALKPLLDKYQVYVTLSDEIVEIGGKNYVKASATIHNVSDIEASLTVTAYAREAESKKGMDDAQVTGATSSYARKYALNGLFLLDDTKDVDTEEYQSQVNKAQNAAKKARQPEPEKNDALICERCKKPISAHERATAEQVANFTLKECGRRLCYDCGKIVKQAQSAPIQEFIKDDESGLPFPIE